MIEYSKISRFKTDKNNKWSSYDKYLYYDSINLKKSNSTQNILLRRSEKAK